VAPSWLGSAAASHPDRAAVVTQDETVSYAHLHDQARLAAGRLRIRGVGPDDRVALQLPPGLPFLVALHGCLAAGAVAVPVDPRLAPAERDRQAAGCQVVVDRPLSGEAHDAGGESDRRPGDPAMIVHTSGTTRAPRPVTLTLGNWEASARGTASALAISPEDRWLCPLPLAHVGGLSIAIRAVLSGFTVVLYEGWDTDAVAGSLRAGEATLVSLVPTMLARLLDAGLERPAGLRCAVMGGAPLPSPLVECARAAGIPLVQTYGSTETCSQVTMSRIGSPETAGRPFPGTRVEVAADGEILIQGPTVAPGALAADGFLHTGDLGALDADKNLTITGRRAETIVTGGENVSPLEVEAALQSHPAVAEAMVYGRPDPEWGEAVTAAVVLRAGSRASPDDLRAHCAERIARFKVPKAVRFLDALPRTPSGKLLRRTLQ
jgi:o-succinylbenzoate---CoA ligase